MANDTKKTALPQTARERQGAEPPGWEDWGHPCSACSDANLCRENAGRAYRRGRGCEGASGLVGGVAAGDVRCRLCKLFRDADAGGMTRALLHCIQKSGVQPLLSPRPLRSCLPRGFGLRF